MWNYSLEGVCNLNSWLQGRQFRVGGGCLRINLCSYQGRTVWEVHQIAFCRINQWNQLYTLILCSNPSTLQTARPSSEMVWMAPSEQTKWASLSTGSYGKVRQRQRITSEYWMHTGIHSQPEQRMYSTTEGPSPSVTIWPSLLYLICMCKPSWYVAPRTVHIASAKPALASMESSAIDGLCKGRIMTISQEEEEGGKVLVKGVMRKAGSKRSTLTVERK